MSFMMQDLALIVTEPPEALDRTLVKLSYTVRTSHRHVRLGITILNLFVRRYLYGLNCLQALVVHFGTNYAARKLAMTP